MKKVIFILALFSFMAAFPITNNSVLFAEDEKLVKVPVSVSYSSIYWWRGVELLGDGVGVFWPGISLEIGGLTLGVSSGISEDWISREDTASEDIHKSYTEIDYLASYSLELKPVSISVGLYYYQWPFYDEADPTLTDWSFWEGFITLGLDTILNPSVEFYYDYYDEAYIGSDGKEVPVDEDYYIKLGLSQDLISKDGFTFSIAASVGYYNNAYLERTGWSDAVGKLGISKEYGDLSFSSSFNYGRSLSKDFIGVYSDAAGNTYSIKNHFWCDFGISYTL